VPFITGSGPIAPTRHSIGYRPQSLNEDEFEVSSRRDRAPSDRSPAPFTEYA
jgi:hypothetical protein